MDLSCPDHLFPNTQQLFPGMSERSYTQNYFSVLYVCDKHQCNTITHNFLPSSLVFLTYIDPVVVKNKVKKFKTKQIFQYFVLLYFIAVGESGITSTSHSSKAASLLRSTCDC